MNKERAIKMALHAVLASVLFVQATLEAHVDGRYIALGVIGIAVKDVLSYLSKSPTAPDADAKTAGGTNSSAGDDTKSAVDVM